MSIRRLCQKTVYYNKKASDQKNEVLEIFINRYGEIQGKIQHTLLYEGITVFISQDPFSYPATVLIDPKEGLYSSKSFFGNEPLEVTIAFFDKKEGCRYFEALRIKDTNNNVLVA